VRPEVELNRIGGFRVKREVAPVADGQIDEVLQRLREENAVWQPVETEPPVSGDMVVVEITPLDDELAEPQKPRMYQLVLGEGQAAQAIEDVIRTLEPGSEGDFTVDLPENADEPASPTKAHRLHLVLREAKRPDLPEADDEFAKGLGDFGSLDELRERIRTDLEREADNEAERQVRGRLVADIVESNPFEVPGSMTDEYLSRLLPDREGLDAARLAEMRETTRPAAQNALRRMLIVERVATMESLHASPADVEARISEIAERLGRPPAEVRGQFQKSGRLNEIEEEITEERVFDYLKSLSTIE
ncbi:MAG: trigger factor, partial [Longimicrobiales bacterium]